MIEYITENFPQLLTAGTLGYLFNKLISHRLSVGRNVENFNRKTKHDSNERNKIMLSLLGELSNSILNCLEESAINASVSKSISKNAPKDRLNSVTLAGYNEIKNELIKYNSFTPSMWHNLDRLPERVEETNLLINEKHPSEIYAQLYWFTEMCESYWAIVAESYVNSGGNIKDLTKPMPIPYK